MQTGDNGIYDCLTTVPNYEDEFIDGAANPLYNAMDNCDVTVTQDPAPGTSIDDAGVCDDPIVVTVTATDSAGNTATGTATVTLEDNVDPAITCPMDITVTPEAGDCDGEEVTIPVPVYVEPTLDGDGNVIPPTNPADPSTGAYTDDCDCVTLSGPDTTVPLDASNTGTFPIGTTTVSYTATDAAGNTATCTFTVTVLPPASVIECNGSDMASATLDADENCEATHEWPTPTVEACDESTPLSAICVYPDGSSAPCASGDAFPLGTTEITYADAPQCNLSVTVVDNTPPTVDPQDVMEATSDNGVYDCDVIIPNYEDEFIDGMANPLYNAMDNCDVTVTQDPAPGTVFDDGGVCNDPITVTVTATDSEGNSTTGTATVTLNDDVDPLITCPDDISLSGECEGAEATIPIPVYVEPTLDADGNPLPPTNPVTGAYTDDCDCVTLSGPTTDNGVVLDGTNTATFPVGVTTLTYTATDAAGNTATCTFTVTVTAPEPVIECNGSDLASATYEANDNCEAPHDWPSPTIDECDTSTPIPAICVYPDGSSAPCTSGDGFPVGTTEVTFEGAEQCNFTVTVLEEFTFNCPSTIKVPNDEGECGADVYWNPPVIIGECSGGSGDINIPAECTYPDGTVAPCASGDHFPVGITTVVMGDEDDNCSFEVRVLDTEKPVIECPDDITVSVAGQGCKAIVEWVRPDATDNCGVVTFNGTHSETGTYFTVGTTTVIYKAVDASGNTGTCNFTITVVDDLEPEAACPDDITLAEPGTADWTPPNPVDNCVAEGVLILATHEPGDFFDQTTTVTYMFEDAAGNVNECSFTVTVDGGTAPRLAARAAMEGASMNGGGMMRDDLRKNPLMPTSFGLVSPYGDNTGINSAMLTEITNTDVAVDWILIEIRDANNPAQVLMDVSALVQRDGDIMAADGSSYVTLNGLTNGDYHVAIRHRNHLGMMTATPVYLDANAPMLDFTDPNFQTWGTNARFNMGGTMVMVAGDATGDGAITAADRSDIWNNRNTQSYMMQDCDMNGATTAADRNISYNNRNTIEQLPQ